MRVLAVEHRNSTLTIERTPQMRTGDVVLVVPRWWRPTILALVGVMVLCAFALGFLVGAGS